MLLTVQDRGRDVPASDQTSVRIVEEAKQAHLQATSQPTNQPTGQAQHNEQINGSVKAAEELRPIHEQGGTLKHKESKLIGSRK